MYLDWWERWDPNKFIFVHMPMVLAYNSDLICTGLADDGLQIWHSTIYELFIFVVFGISLAATAKKFSYGEWRIIVCFLDGMGRFCHYESTSSPHSKITGIGNGLAPFTRSLPSVFSLLTT